MDYEKEYKEALERAKAGKPMDEVFPELKESEDERIRKLLVWQVHRNIEDETNDLAQSVYDGIKGHDPDLEESIEDWKKCLAYLEKQKEQKPADIAPNQFDGITYGMSGASTEHSKEWSEEEKIMSDIIFAIKEVWMEADADRMIAYLERHKEPFIIHDTGCSKRGAKMPEYCLDVKPAEWSEEDKKKLDFVISVCIDAQRPSGCAEGSVYYNKLNEAKKWLKSLRPQPKAELTLLDENIINAAVAFVEQNNHFDCWRGINKHTVIKALRSPQPHWKPSEEQMDALMRTITWLVEKGNHTDSSTLADLRSNLQKLM